MLFALSLYIYIYTTTNIWTEEIEIKNSKNKINKIISKFYMKWNKLVSFHTISCKKKKCKSIRKYLNEN